MLQYFPHLARDSGKKTDCPPFFSFFLFFWFRACNPRPPPRRLLVRLCVLHIDMVCSFCSMFT